MTRFLFVVPPLPGHVHPAAGVAAELVRRGHEVSWAGDGPFLRGLLGPDANVHRCTLPALPQRPDGLRGFGALRFLWEDVLVPLAEAMVPCVEDMIVCEQPDVLVVDQQALAAAFVAERIGIPWVTSATTSSELTDPLAAVPKARDWVAGLLAELRGRFGDPAATHDPRFSPHLILGYTTAALAGDLTADYPQLCLVGPVDRPEAGRDEAGESDDDRPLVYVSLGTMNTDAGADFLRECAAAVADRPWLRAVLVDPAGVVPDPAPNLIVRCSVRQLAVLDRAAAVICHAGHNTVCEALARGVPLVVAPIRDDQPVVADQVVRAGAGVRVRFAHARAQHIGAAVDTVLGEPSYANAARAIADSFRTAGGAAAAADQLEVVAVDHA